MSDINLGDLNDVGGIDFGDLRDPAHLFPNPQRQYLGGSEDALNQQRQQMQQGIGQGQAYTNAGMKETGNAYGFLQDSMGQAIGNRNAAQGMYDRGVDLGNGAVAAQNSAINDMVHTAEQRTPSLAQAQQDAAMRQAQQNALSQAAAGGNSALATRNAILAGGQNQANAAQNAAMLRAQEEAAYKATLMQAQNAAQGAYGQRAGLGYGAQAQGLGAMNTATGLHQSAGQAYGSLGMGQANAGINQQGVYVGGQTEQGKSQLQADTDVADKKAAGIGGLLGGVGGMIAAL